ncbi:CMRF35-like molecule 8 [Ascaphus truei]|uniref:CMRF35-like molecule 8 n=1 Tax=Ascaphus truei TaxID=8439 RepID=UPI003F5A2AEE
MTCMAYPRNMTVSFCTTFIVLLLFLALSASLEEVTGSVGDTLLLPCTYSAHEGTNSMCWGRGSCTYSKCNNVIIWTDGSTVTQRKSERYKLMGNVAQGDVSLTITGVQRADEGTYCCRVEIPGLFNDQKKEITVEITEAQTENLAVPTRTSSSSDLTSVADTSRSILSTSPPGNVSFSSEENQESTGLLDPMPHIIAGVVLLLLLIISLAVLVYRCSYHRTKMSGIVSTTPVLILGALDRAPNQATDNIYLVE